MQVPARREAFRGHGTSLNVPGTPLFSLVIPAEAGIHAFRSNKKDSMQLKKGNIYMPEESCG